MSDVPQQNESQKDVIANPVRSRFPKRMIVFSAVAILISVGVQLGYESLSESIGLDPGVANVISMGLMFLTALGWYAWIAFASRWSVALKLVTLSVLGLLPLLGFVFFQPVFDGDLGLVRFEPRFFAAERAYARSDSAADDSTAAANAASVSLAPTEFDFPQFLGPNRNAIVTNVALTKSWKQDPPKTEWTIEVGDGWSGFAIVGDLAFTQEQRDELECVTCYDVESGEQQWCYAVERRHEDLSAMGRVGPRATPTVSDGKVYAVSGTGVLDCLDGATGRLVWTVDVPSLVGIEQLTRVNGRGLQYTQEGNSSLTWGRSGSPLVYQDLVIVPAGGPVGGDAVTMIAFDRDTGAERWRGGDRTTSYGSPALIDVEGEPQICLIAEDAAVGHDPQTGEELWSHQWPGHSDGDASCSQVTSIGETSVLLSKGYGAGGQTVRLLSESDGWKTETIQANARVVRTKMTNPVIYQGHAYSLSDGFMECTEVPSLKRRWKKRGRFGHGQLLLVGDKLLVHSEHGVLYLIAADPQKFQQLGKHKTIDGVCWNTISLSGDRLLVRSELQAAMIRLPLDTAPLTP